MTEHPALDLQSIVARAIRDRGGRETCQKLGLDRETTRRIAAGAPVRNGSLALRASTSTPC